MTTDELHAAVTRRLAGSRQRYTPSRRALVEALREAGAPITMGELLVRHPRLHQSTAYRNLAVLEQLGVITRLLAPPGAEAHHELAEPFLAHHHHLVCSTCGAMRDCVVPARLERALQAAATAATAGEFHVHTHRLDFLGTCRRCA